MRCPRHPAAGDMTPHCPACLMESALATSFTAAPRPLEILLPLGSSAHSTVFVVRSAGSGSELLRLKMWSAPAASGFVERFEVLRRGLSALASPHIQQPIGASLDADGRALVLTEFRRGMTLGDALRCGRLDAGRAVHAIETAREAIEAAHRAGLVHGAVGPGNILFDSEPATACVLDFGFGALIAGDMSSISPSGDLAGIARLIRLVSSGELAV